ncbi:MAG: hypothetical protein RJA70_2568 [Pseudomonadota bacterium]|jgi:two-component system cell cycle response regulator
MSPPSSIRRRPRILITDDSASQRRLIREELAELCVELCEAGTGAEALKAVAEFQPDLVTLDIEMPVLNGFHVLEQLKRMDRTMTIPVIMISSLESEKQRIRALEGGAIEYFQKPFPEGALKQLVSEALGRLESNRRKRICCVDDSAQMRGYVRQLMQTHGYKCECFGSLEDLRNYMQFGVCDLILVDLHMPDGTSYEFLESLRENERSAGLAKIGTTGFGARRDLLNAFQLGVDDFIRKPFYAEELLARVDHLLRIKETENRLRQIATIDPLTELHNRGEVLRRFAVEISRARRDSRDLGVLMVDVDHFKRVNDTLGHAQGDQVLRQVAQVLRDDLRVTDVIGRYGGEEFVALLPQATDAGVRFLAERLRERVAQQEFVGDDHNLRVTVSVGGCVWPFELLDPELSLEQCILPADQALYEAKRSGRNRVVLKQTGRVVVTRPPSSFRGMGRSIPAPRNA